MQSYQNARAPTRTILVQVAQIPVMLDNFVSLEQRGGKNVQRKK